MQKQKCRSMRQREADTTESGDWDCPQSSPEGAFLLPWVADNTFWPNVNRIFDVYGNRNLFCACVPMEAYEN